MLQKQKTVPPVNAVLRVHMVVDGENREKGEVVELSARDFAYLKNHDRVAEATKENVAAVEAEVEAEQKAAKLNVKAASETESLKAQLALANAKLAELAKK